MTYQGNISNKIKNIFSKSNINIAFSVPEKNQIAMKNNDRKIEMNSESGIYKLTCDCNSIYIRITFRKFKRRIYEHYHSFLYNLPDKSNFAAHLLQTNHIFSGFTKDIFNFVRNIALICHFMILFFPPLFVNVVIFRSFILFITLRFNL